MDKYFLIGIKGAGMAPLARILKQQDHFVVGSDVDTHVSTQLFLDSDGIEYFNFNEYEFDSSYKVIVGNSFTDEFLEVEKASKLNCETFWYFEYLGLLSKQYTSIAVTGTHGKTTTTTFLKNVLSIEKQLAYLIGDGNGGSCVEPEFFVFEACEYKNHFLSYFPKHAIITNVGHDHRDYFKTEAMYDEAFINFSENVSGKLIVCGDDEHARELFVNNSKTIFYGLNDNNDFVAKNVVFSETGCVFDLIIYGEYILTYNTAVFGKHNVLNLLSTLVIAYLEKCNLELIVEQYQGVISPKRRFEEYIYNHQIIIDDYAHHPDELHAFLDSVFQKYSGKKIIAVFEPHTIARLEEHYQSFAKELNRCDQQVLLNVKIPLRDIASTPSDHIESDIMLEYLDNASMYNENTLNELSKINDCIVLFIGATIFEYTEKYINLINLIYQEK